MGWPDHGSFGSPTGRGERAEGTRRNGGAMRYIAAPCDEPPMPTIRSVRPTRKKDIDDGKSLN